jgi:AAA15 family ATPase/GTPase
LSASLKNQDSFGDSEKLFIMKMLALLFPIAEIIIVKNFESLFPIAILLVVYVILYAILKPEIDSDKIYWKNHDKKNHEKNC